MRRSDGVKVESSTARGPDGKEYPMRVIENPLTGTRSVLNGLIEAKTTYQMSRSSILGLTQPPADCGSDPASERKSMLGYSMVRHSVAVPNLQKHHQEFWRAPELACEIMQYTMSVAGPTGAEMKLMEKNAISVDIGEPDPSAFEIPDWPERSPSEVAATFEKKFNLPKAPTDTAGLDHAYRPQPRPIQ